MYKYKEVKFYIKNKEEGLEKFRYLIMTLALLKPYQLRSILLIKKHLFTTIKNFPIEELKKWIN